MILDLGLVDYTRAYTLQRTLVAQRLAGAIADTLIACRHHPVYTVGRGAPSPSFSPGPSAAIVAVDRGGALTFHGPGQVTLYPIVDLKQRCMDLHRHLRDLEEVAISFLATQGVSGERKTGRTGVWIGERKIASVGIACRNWVTYHGISILIEPDDGHFSRIDPCGLKGVRMISLAETSQRLQSAQTALAPLAALCARYFAIAPVISNAPGPA